MRFLGHATSGVSGAIRPALSSMHIAISVSQPPAPGFTQVTSCKKGGRRVAFGAPRDQISNRFTLFAGMPASQRYSGAWILSRMFSSVYEPAFAMDQP